MKVYSLIKEKYDYGFEDSTMVGMFISMEVAKANRLRLKKERAKLVRKFIKRYPLCDKDGWLPDEIEKDMTIPERDIFMEDKFACEYGYKIKYIINEYEVLTN